jgi:ABC-type taurine transport system substrate-binding protein
MVAYFSKKSRLVILIISLTFVVGFFLWLLFKKDQYAVYSLSLSHDFTDHPIYSNYNFSSSDSIISIGVQPMYLPTGIIMEILKRDNILKDELKKNNIKIKYFPFLKGTDVNYFMQKGLIDAGIGGDMPALMAASTSDVIIPIILQKGNASIISNQPMLSNQLEGKKIAFPYGSIAHYFILELLNNADIKESEVELIPMELHEMTSALYENEIDLFSAWEPVVSASKKQHPYFFTAYQKITTGYLYFLKPFAKQQPEVVKQILAAIIRSIAWMKDNPENLRMACQWSSAEIEKFTKNKSSLTDDERMILARQDILRYYSKYAVVIDEDDKRINSMLFKEYQFLKSLNKELINTNWENVSKCFDNELVVKVFNQPKHFKLNEFDYSIGVKK